MPPHHSDDLDPRAQVVVATAVRAVAGADGAVLRVVGSDGHVDVLAASSATARRADALQEHAGEGPGGAVAAGEARTLRVPDVARERRWPAWARAVQAHSPYRSVLVRRVVEAPDRVGVLSLWFYRTHGFRTADEAGAAALDDLAANVVGWTHEVAGLRAALESRTLIGQATGRVMERYDIDAERAFAVLTRLSSHQNRKLRDLAAEIVASGTTAGLADPAPDPQVREGAAGTG